MARCGKRKEFVPLGAGRCRRMRTRNRCVARPSCHHARRRSLTRTCRVVAECTCGRRQEVRMGRYGHASRGRCRRAAARAPSPGRGGRGHREQATWHVENALGQSPRPNVPLQRARPAPRVPQPLASLGQAAGFLGLASHGAVCAPGSHMSQTPSPDPHAGSRTIRSTTRTRTTRAPR